MTWPVAVAIAGIWIGVGLSGMGGQAVGFVAIMGIAATYLILGRCTKEES